VIKGCGKFDFFIVIGRKDLVGSPLVQERNDLGPK